MERSPRPLPTALAAALLLQGVGVPAAGGPGDDRGVAWRAEAPVPQAAAKDCPMRKLEAHFWDTLENDDRPVTSADWEGLSETGKVEIIKERCGSAAQVHEVFVDVKVRLDYALRMARGSAELSRRDKGVLIDRTLSETAGPAGMVEERLGKGSTLVMVLADTKRVLEIERSNLAALQGGAKTRTIEEAGSLAGASRVRGAASGSLGERAQALDHAFSGGSADRMRDELDLPVGGGARGTGSDERQAGGAMRARASRFDPAGMGQEVPEPADKRGWTEGEKEAGKAISESFQGALGFGNKKKGVRAQEDARERPAAEALAGYSRVEQAYIEKRKDDAWFGFGWFAEYRAKRDVESLRSHLQWCDEHPAACARNRAACAKDPDMITCGTYRIRRDILGGR